MAEEREALNDEDMVADELFDDEDEDAIDETYELETEDNESWYKGRGDDIEVQSSASDSNERDGGDSSSDDGGSRERNRITASRRRSSNRIRSSSSPRGSSRRSSRRSSRFLL